MPWFYPGCIFFHNNHADNLHMGRLDPIKINSCCTSFLLLINAITKNILVVLKMKSKKI